MTAPSRPEPVDDHLRYDDGFVHGVHYRTAQPIADTGIRTPIVLVHGAFTGSWIYRQWLWFFAACGWPTYAISLRGHDRSPLPPTTADPKSVSIEEYVDDVLRVVEHVGGRGVLVGHSMGGLVVQKVAEVGGADAVILVASVGPGQMGPHDKDFPTDSLVDYRSTYLASRSHLAIDDETFGWVLENLVPESPRALNQCRGRVPVDRQAIASPVLAIGAAKDETRVPDARAIAAFYEADHLIVENATHDVMVDPAWHVAAVAINSWLMESCPPPISHRIVRHARSQTESR